MPAAIEKAPGFMPLNYRFSGEKLRDARKQARVTLMWLAVQLSNQKEPANVSTISLWERNVYEPKVSQFFLIATLLKKHPAFFFEPIDRILK